MSLPAKKIISSSQDRTQTNEQPQTKTNTNATLDACSLLTDSEIASVLGEPLQERKPSVQATGNMRMSQCVFVTRDFAKSASFAVATPAATCSGGGRLRALPGKPIHSAGQQGKGKRTRLRKKPAEGALTPSREG